MAPAFQKEVEKQKWSVNTVVFMYANKCKVIKNCYTLNNNNKLEKNI